jgi:hypothetical protein
MYGKLLVIFQEFQSPIFRILRSPMHRGDSVRKNPDVGARKGLVTMKGLLVKQANFRRRWPEQIEL